MLYLRGCEYTGAGAERPRMCGELFFSLRFVAQIGGVGALVGLDVLEAALAVTDGVQLGTPVLLRWVVRFPLAMVTPLLVLEMRDPCIGHVWRV